MGCGLGDLRYKFCNSRFGWLDLKPQLLARGRDVAHESHSVLTMNKSSEHDKKQKNRFYLLSDATQTPPHTLSDQAI